MLVMSTPTITPKKTSMEIEEAPLHCIAARSVRLAGSHACNARTDDHAEEDVDDVTSTTRVKRCDTIFSMTLIWKSERRLESLRTQICHAWTWDLHWE
jgi:hypothetical protein